MFIVSYILSNLIKDYYKSQRRTVRRAVQGCNRILTFFSTSSMVWSGTLLIKVAFLIFQSKLFNWSDRITPVTFNPSGSMISEGYSLAWFVMGHCFLNISIFSFVIWLFFCFYFNETIVSADGFWFLVKNFIPKFLVVCR